MSTYKSIIEDIVNSRSNPVDYRYSITINSNGKEISPSFLISVDTLRDYTYNYADYVVVDFLLGNGDYQYYIAPYKDNITAVLTSTIDGSVSAVPMKAVVLNNKDTNTGSVNQTASRDTLNNLGLIHVTMQLVDLAVEVMRGTNVFGIVRSSTVKSAITSKIIDSISAISIGGNALDARVTLSDPDNNKFYDHITIAPGISVFDLPTYIQETDYGVYNKGLGTYFQRFGDDSCGFYVYPQNDTDGFDESEKKIIIYSYDDGKYDNVESTYKVDGNLIKIIAGGGKKSIDNGESDMMDMGVEIKSLDSDRLLQKNVLVRETGIDVSSNANIHAQSLASRSDGARKSKYVGVDSNTYKSRAAIHSRSMAPIQIKWNSCNPNLIYPGIPLMYVYLDRVTGLNTLYGSISSVFYRYNHKTRSMSAFVNITVTKANFYKYTGLKDDVR